VYTAGFWAGAFDRVIKSFAQALLLMWGADEGFNLISINFPQSLGVAAGAAVLSLLTSVISAPVADRGSTSLLPGGQ
jgi:hypothetical protein